MFTGFAQHVVPIARRTLSELRADQTVLVASAVAFRMTLAVFPAAALLAWVTGEFAGPDTARQVVEDLSGVIPDSTRTVIESAMASSFQHGPGERGEHLPGLGFLAPVLGLAFTLWAANGGTKALFNALNWIYDKEERRGFARFTLLTLAFTLALLFCLAATAALLVLAPALAASDVVSNAGWVRWLKWPLLLGAGTVGLSLLNRFAPNREREHWPWITVGSALAALLLLAGSALFSWFVATFASLALTYGSLAGVAAFMLWLWMSFTIVLAGAELDACIEHETGIYARRTAGGGSRPDGDPP